MNIEFWAKSNCPKCDATKRVLDTGNVTIAYRSFDDESGLFDEAKARGFLGVPVVVTPDEAWSGYRPDKLIELPKWSGKH